MNTVVLNIQKGVNPMVIALLLLISFGVFPVFPQEESEGRNWRLILGVGGGFRPVYNGSDEIAPVGLPYINAVYKARHVTLFLDRTEAGIRWERNEKTPFSLSAGMKLGQSRRTGNVNIIAPDDNIDILEGTAKLENNYQVFASLDIPLTLGTLSSTINFLPIEASYDEPGRPGKDFDGVLVEAG
jgi:hypothetical protein